MEISCFDNCVYVTGNARTSERSTVGKQTEVFAVEVVINIATDQIVEASCTLVTELGRQFVRKLLIGHNFILGLEEIIRDIDLYYQALPKKSLIAALKDANNKYKNFKKKVTL
ncbi:hypothetical protein JCM14036_32570 [Desulfotomaculum defluvii]